MFNTKMFLSASSIALVFFAIISLVNAKCLQIHESGVGQDDINTIIVKHNEYRLDVANGRVPGQPRGCNLKRLKWDDNLAVLAQNYANTCPTDNKSPHDDRWDFVGQNMYVVSSSEVSDGADWAGMLNAIASHRKEFKYGAESTTNYLLMYNQMIWATTEYVGCGYTFHFDGSMHTKVYLCYYGPGGNIINLKPYEIQQHCEPCGCDNLC